MRHLTRKPHSSSFPAGKLLLTTLALGTTAFWLENRRRQTGIDDRTKARLQPRRKEQA